MALAGCGLLVVISSGMAFLGGCDETLHRSDEPVSREVASKAIGMSFPPSAKDVYYLFHAGGMQEMEEFVRFTVDPKALDKTVSDLLAEHDKSYKEHNSYPQKAVTDTQFSPDAKFLPVDWWIDPFSITNGYFRGSSPDGRSIYIWADVANHTIYYCETD
jgi:hypothetical protein